MTDAARTEQPDHIKAAAAEASIDEQIAEVKRELAMRRNAYPGFVRSGRLTQEKADQQTARLLAVLHTLMASKVARDLLALVDEIERGMVDALTRGAIGPDDDQWANEMCRRARELIVQAGGQRR